MPNERSAGVILFRVEEGVRKYLLLHYEKDHWDFPKGHVEQGETDKEAAVRETKEETGITQLRFIEGFTETLSYFYRRDGKTFHKEVIFFLAETGQSEIKISHEHIGFVWLEISDAITMATFKSAKELLEKAHRFLKSDGVNFL